MLAIDIGNTRTKVACFTEKQMGKVHSFPSKEFEEQFSAYIKELPTPPARIGWISVAQKLDIRTLNLWTAQKITPHFSHIHTLMDLPVKMGYQTPQTLGTDRIVAAIGAKAQISNHKQAILVIDAGTAITYDCINSEGMYLGGGIAPGIRMRFQALHHFTARLPLIETIKAVPLIGDSTHNSMLSGVVNGVLAEVEGIIQRYKEQFNHKISVFLTGGDALFFENHLKSINFVDAQLVLKGIFEILRWEDAQTPTNQ